MIPIEVKFRSQIESADFAGLMALHKKRRFECAIMVTRDTWDRRTNPPCLMIPLLDFLLAF
jgi:predicted AAA+ superfamily ATPase